MKKNILIVDDDSMSHFLIEKCVRPLYWIGKIDSVRNGKEGLQVLEQHCSGLGDAPDLILLDLHMPVMDGFGFLECYNMMQCMKSVRVVIVVLTSSDNPEERKRVESMGVRHFVRKPISAETLDLIVSTEFRGVL